MPSPEEIRLATLLAGQVNRDLDGAVNKNKINPHNFLANAGLQPRQQQRPQHQIHIPGMVEAPKATPAGEESFVTASAPDLIPLPEDLKKFVSKEEFVVGRVIPAQGIPSHIPTGPQLPMPSAMDMWNKLLEIEQLLRSVIKQRKSKSKYKKKKTKNEINTVSVPRPREEEGTDTGSANQTA